jgi:hypothetical protein
MKSGHSFPEVDQTTTSDQAISVHQNLQKLIINDQFFWGQNLYIIVASFAQIFPTRINEMKQLKVPHKGCNADRPVSLPPKRNNRSED